MKLFFPEHLRRSIETTPGPHIPQNLLLQWHVTERCNLRCSHCYQESFGGKELPFEGLLDVLDQFRSLLANWRQKTPLRGHLTLSGGEPFVRSDFMDFLKVVASHKDEFSFSILSNGSFITPALALELKKLGPTFIQISLEGSEETHDRIRGQGDYQQTVQAISMLVAEKIPTMISFTAHQDNFREFPQVARLGRKLRVQKVWSDRLIPHGVGKNMIGEQMTPEQTQEFFAIMKQAREQAPDKWFSKTEIAMDRALQFMVGDGKPYRCYAGDSLITIQPNGDLLPCRRMPIPVGNVLQTPLETLYYQSDLFQDLRDENKISEGCEPCFYKKICRGGLKCLSLATEGDPFVKDPGCWR